MGFMVAKAEGSANSETSLPLFHSLKWLAMDSLTVDIIPKNVTRD